MKKRQASSTPMINSEFDHPGKHFVQALVFARLIQRQYTGVDCMTAANAVGEGMKKQSSRGLFDVKMPGLIIQDRGQSSLKRNVGMKTSLSISLTMRACGLSAPVACLCLFALC